MPAESEVARELTGRWPTDDGGVIFAGDLVWNGYVPNYRDAAPMQLSRTVADWVLFHPAFLEVAIAAWFEELGATGK